MIWLGVFLKWAGGFLGKYWKQLLIVGAIVAILATTWGYGRAAGVRSQEVKVGKLKAKHELLVQQKDEVIAALEGSLRDLRASIENQNRAIQELQDRDARYRARLAAGLAEREAVEEERRLLEEENAAFRDRVANLPCEDAIDAFVADWNSEVG